MSSALHAVRTIDDGTVLTLREAGPNRLAYLDNLKVLMVAGVIAGHAIAGYAGMNWTYADVAEGEMGVLSQSVFGLLILPFAVFVMALFFLVAGLLTPGSLDRKGPGRFARDRLVRLGIPLAAFTLVLWPLMTYGLYRAAGSDWSLWDVYADDPTLDNGPLWFVEALLIFSLAYAGWRAWRMRRPDASRKTSGLLRPSSLVVVGAVIAIATFIVRLWFPFDSLQFTNAHVWQWPECIGLFGLGIVSARRGWLRPVPGRIRRGCGWVGRFLDPHSGIDDHRAGWQDLHGNAVHLGDRQMMFGERADPQDDLLQRGYVALGRASKAIPEWERAERSNHLLASGSLIGVMRTETSLSNSA